jgi:hypothetical protein
VSKYFVDLAERTAATFAFAFLSAFSFSNLSSWHDAAIGGAAAAATVVKSLLAGYISGGNSAGLGSSK